MALNFSVQKYPAFGSYGEFSVGGGATKVRAQYLLTKIRPGQQGLWENQLASQMAPWREIFKIEELSFDELIQRDLDDSRVAHDLIPYLLGETGQHARFFPPILAVLVPKREDKSGIAPRYPAPTPNGEHVAFGDLFDFEKVTIENQISPLGRINYNPQRTAIVIVDGQHRAMAVLALHRQLNKSWGADPFAPYYDHIQVTAQTVAHIELPVCILFFPDLNEESSFFKEAGIDLVTVCREIFTVVNRQAKHVSKSRALLLDDEDFAAFMMRRTLTRFKDRSENALDIARIYSFAFGDSEADGGSQVMAGQLEFCSAVALHKMHAATGFALPAAFNLTRTADVTDGRNVRNPARTVEILTGSNGPNFQSISRQSAKRHKPGDVEFITEHVAELTDAIMLPIFDALRPFATHNQAMRELLQSLDDVTARADPVQSKVRALLFDGTSNRNVFDEHVNRLRERAKELQDTGQPVPAHLASQLTYCDAVNRALQEREESVKLRRAFLLFNIDQAPFSARDRSLVDLELRRMKVKAKSIFDAVSTQAFQIGYLMAVLTQVEKVLPLGASYDLRLSTTKLVSSIFLKAMNAFFGTTQTKHRTLSGYVTEARASAFEANEPGFRGLLASTNVREMNEKQWEFFRYFFFEVVHSKMAASSVLELLNAPENAAFAAAYRKALPDVLSEIETIRERYFEAAFVTATKTQEFRREIEVLEVRAKAEGKPDADIKLMVDAEVKKKKLEVNDASKEHLRASLGRLDSRAAVLKRLDPPAGTPTNDEAVHEDEPEGDAAGGIERLPDEMAVEETIDAAVATEELLHQSEAED